MHLSKNRTGEYITSGILLDGTHQSHAWDRAAILSKAYQTLNRRSTKQAVEVAEFLRDGATEAEWILAALENV